MAADHPREGSVVRTVGETGAKRVAKAKDYLKEHIVPIEKSDEWKGIIEIKNVTLPGKSLRQDEVNHTHRHTPVR